jgi:hypothetical protein
MTTIILKTLFVLYIAVTLAILMNSSPAQVPAPTRDERVWYWFGNCPSTNALRLDVSLNGNSVFDTSFSLCRMCRGDVPTDHRKYWNSFSMPTLKSSAQNIKISEFNISKEISGKPAASRAPSCLESRSSTRIAFSLTRFMLPD